MEGEDFALAREEVVLDAEALHGEEVALEDGGRDLVGDGGSVAASLFIDACFKGVEGGEADGFAGGELVRVGGVPLRDAGVEIPAEVVNALVGLEELFHELADTGEGEAEEVDEADDDVGDLDAGVVDVVLHANLPAGLEVVGAEESLEGVAEDGVAEVADVGGLVGVDAGVLDEAKAGAAEVGVVVGGDVLDGGGAIEAEVEVAGAGEIDGGDAGKIAAGDGGLEVGEELLSDGARGFTEAFGELKGDGGGEFAQVDVGWLLGRDIGEVEGVEGRQGGAEVGDEALLQGSVHVLVGGDGWPAARRFGREPRGVWRGAGRCR